MKYCTDGKMAFDVITIARKAMRPLIQMATEDCQKPCKIRSFKFSPLIRNANQFKSYVYISLISEDIIVQENVRIFDGNGIVGTIGGSLGLFIGFSFFSCIKDLMATILDHYISK